MTQLMRGALLYAMSIARAIALSPWLTICLGVAVRRSQGGFPVPRRRKRNAGSIPRCPQLHIAARDQRPHPVQFQTSPYNLGRLHCSCFSHLHSALLANPSVLPTRS